MDREDLHSARPSLILNRVGSQSDLIYEDIVPGIMSATIVPMPITLEQLAAAVRRLSAEDRKRLFKLVSEMEETGRSPFSVSEALAAAEAAREEIRAEMEEYPLPSDTPFLRGLTVGEYLTLSDEERARLWDEWTKDSESTWKEVDVTPDAMPAR